MKKLSFILMLLALTSCGWAQTKYTERLDSIVVRDENVPDNSRKFEFSYTEEGKVDARLF